MKYVIYILVLIFITFISFCMYTIPNEFLPTSINKKYSIINIPDANTLLMEEYRTLSDLFNTAINTLSNLNTQIALVQVAINNIEEDRLEKRKIYLANENQLLADIKSNIEKIRLIEFSVSNIEQIKNLYIFVNQSIDQSITSLNDYYTDLHNSMNLILEYTSVIKSNYLKIHSLSPFIDDVNFGPSCIEEINGLTSSSPCRGQPDYLITICETNDIDSYETVYLLLPILNTIVGNNKLIENVNDEDNKILDIQPLV